MKHLKRFNENIEGPKEPSIQNLPGHNQPDPWNTLQGDDLKVFLAVEQLESEFQNMEWYDKQCEISQIEPIITSITAQNRNTSGGRSMLETNFDKDYYIFLNNFYGRGYIEIETDLSTDSGRLYPSNTEPSSHGSPASYGYEVYSYERKSGKVEYDRDFFKFVLRDSPSYSE